MSKSLIIAIDGPAGSGKSTIAKFLAEKLKLLYIDTGAMYRAVTLNVLNNRIDPSNAEQVSEIAANSRIGLKRNNNGLIVMLNDKDVTEQIRSKEVNAAVSDIAKIKEVRKIMVKQQQMLGKGGGVILEGRDIGTVVFPDADFKFFLDAAPGERARRRYDEIKGKYAVTLTEIERNVSRRDNIDSNREAGPLKQAADAVYIDTTDLTIEEVVERILKIIR
ncbi:MAG: cytidylate kinase [Candidatus Omnitrophica bacterium CG11_big_fil_rev_8_21_14_0_20_42_13]|uniref:Cytidylate kinase n=1 Tax=Candidatus Ghiorseimicrobium undicola TaxID=1974746 RepID=A0A2H0LZK6_9BACT|nr:MAG: cytidylate kinase [Candidatus Omnitrophica bacterium CG11_big_fil_rev_8_21_14_0_20_42_13]